MSNQVRFDVEVHGKPLLKLVSGLEYTQQFESVPLTAKHWEKIVPGITADAMFIEMGNSHLTWMQRYQWARFRFSKDGKEQKKVGEELKAKLKEIGVSLHSVAETIGMQPTALSARLKGIMPLKAEQKAAIEGIIKDGKVAATPPTKATKPKASKKSPGGQSKGTNSVNGSSENKVTFELVEQFDQERLAQLGQLIVASAGKGLGITKSNVRKIAEQIQRTDTIEDLIAEVKQI